jgi:hypothetical protein
MAHGDPDRPDRGHRVDRPAAAIWLFYVGQVG